MSRHLTFIFFLVLSVQLEAQNLDSIWFLNYKKMFSEFFETMSEPNSINYDTSLYINATYRFTWLPSFHNPISITITGNGRDITAIGKFYCLDRPGDFQNLQSINVDTIQISWHVWLDFQKIKLEESLYWFLPENCISPKLDGAAWLIEGESQMGSKKVYLQSPRKNSSIYNIGLFFTSLFGYTDLY